MYEAIVHNTRRPIPNKSRSVLAPTVRPRAEVACGLHCPIPIAYLGAALTPKNTGAAVGGHFLCPTTLVIIASFKIFGFVACTRHGSVCYPATTQRNVRPVLGEVQNHSPVWRKRRLKIGELPLPQDQLKCACVRLRWLITLCVCARAAARHVREGHYRGGRGRGQQSTA